MKKSDVAEFFGNQTKIADSVGISHQAVSYWSFKGDRKIIPIEWALYFDETTDLEFDKRLYQNGSDKREQK